MIICVAAAFLAFQGRLWWCETGDPLPWSWDIWSRHNSQHLVDPYSFTHILHGILEFWLIGLVFRTVPAAWRFVIAIAIEAAWEAFENSSWIINRYRAETISLDYFGDSILNSLSDIICCGAGFVIAARLRFWKSLALFLMTEAVLILTIRESLLINIVMLIYPIPEIKQWQMAGR